MAALLLITSVSIPFSLPQPYTWSSTPSMAGSSGVSMLHYTGIELATWCVIYPDLQWIDPSPLGFQEQLSWDSLHLL